MPNPTWQNVLSAAIVTAAQIWLLVWIIRRGISQLWLALCTTLGISAVGSVFSLALFVIDALTGRRSDLIPAVYFYSFWYVALVISGMQIWLLWEIVSRVTGCSDRPWLRVGFALIASAAAMGALAVSHHARTPLFVHPVMRMVTIIDRTIWLAWCLLFVGLTLSADLVGLKWRRQIIGITLGFVVQAVAGTFYSWLLTSANTQALDGLTNCAWLVSLRIWALALRESPLLLLTPALEAAFESSLRQLETSGKG